MAPRSLTYACVGATEPASATWTARPPGLLRHESTVVVGHGPAAWDDAVNRVLRWGVKTASGFVVEPAGPVAEGDECRVTFPLGPVWVVEPVRVVAVCREPDRVGFAYGTLAGHPVSGEEAFVVSRDPSGTVRLTLRSLTRPAPSPWALAFPVLLVVQRVVRRRYRRALVRRFD
ncbi:Uncharacterized protein, UPF0548 family [Microlunatus sagamiharensis]|uniref:Uncharacterized protein, UPF0548 family n=1 Tax=Microlunatus sagamiharensis TaxID=546874 RepID=A0A1H2MGD6_9ACTN|nr:DUF1990 domain-containing protein [Microlunatus sagamiharensis]SDU92028.1 Uncharacterized protein, UPF0548 family [Microlunatus sagamiharensis]